MNQEDVSKIYSALDVVMRIVSDDLEKYLESKTFVIRFNIELGVPQNLKNQIIMYNDKLQNILNVTNKELPNKEPLK